MNSCKMKVFTVCTISHFAQALVAMRSLPANISKTIWLIDRLPGAFPCMEDIAVRFADELTGALDLVSGQQYGPFELSCCLKPYVAHLMMQESLPGDIVAYVDGDMFFYGNLCDVSFPEEFCFLLTPHFTQSPPDFYPNSEIEVNQAGLYNGGLFMFRVCSKAGSILKWWWSRLREKCYNATSKGMFVDQIWLNYLPLYFPEDVYVSRQCGVNVGHWNLHQQAIKKVDEVWFASSEPLICYHFSGFSLECPDVLSKHQSRWSFKNYQDLRVLFVDYYKIWSRYVLMWNEQSADMQLELDKNSSLSTTYPVGAQGKLDVYFVADIFMGDQAGIYRYSIEIAKRFYEDSRVNLRFISSGESLDKSMKYRLVELFGPDVELYNRRKLFGCVIQASWSRFFRARYFKFKDFVKVGGRRYLKPVKEFYRVLSQVEKLLWRFSSFHFIGKRPVVFTPFAYTEDVDFMNPSIFKVQVVHDIIPMIHSEYYDSNSEFLSLMSKFPCADVLITVSEHTRKDLIEHCDAVSPSKVHSVPIAASECFSTIDDKSTLSSVKLKYGIPLECDYVFSLSTIEPRKNHIRLLQAWNLVYEELELNMPKLVIGGAHGWGRHYQAELKCSLKTSNSLIMTGFIHDEDLPLLYSGSAFTVYPSMYEGFGIPILESMKCGRFCLTSNVSSMPEIIGSDVPLVDPNSVDSIAEGILRVANDVKLRKNLEKIVLERSKLFCWDKTYRQTLNLISNQMS